LRFCYNKKGDNNLVAIAFLFFCLLERGSRRQLVGTFYFGFVATKKATIVFCFGLVVTKKGMTNLLPLPFVLVLLQQSFFFCYSEEAKAPIAFFYFGFTTTKRQ
jgi:hypothetical protein